MAGGCVSFFLNTRVSVMWLRLGRKNSSLSVLPYFHNMHASSVNDILLLFVIVSIHLISWNIHIHVFKSNTRHEMVNVNYRFKFIINVLLRPTGLVVLIYLRVYTKISCTNNVIALCIKELQLLFTFERWYKANTQTYKARYIDEMSK